MAGSIHKYQNKKGETRYFVMLDLGKDDKGKRKQKKISGFKTKKEASAAMAEAQTDINKGTYIEPSKLTYGEFLDDWFKTKQISIGKQTSKTYDIYLESYIFPSLGHILLSKLSTSNINNLLIGEMLKKEYSPSTIKKAVTIVKKSLEDAIDLELISKNVARKVTLPKEEKTEMQVWNREQVKVFLNTAKDNRLYALFYLALMNGLRQGELLGLRWKDIDFFNQTLSIRQVLSHDAKEIIKGAKTKSSIRTIELGDSTVKVLKTHKALINEEKLKNRKSYQDQDLVFCTAIGTPINPSNIRNRYFNPLIEKSNVPKIRFHDMRHSCVSLLLSAGVNIKIISEMLGHSSIKITLDTYSHILPTMQKEAVKQLENMINL